MAGTSSGGQTTKSQIWKLPALCLHLALHITTLYPAVTLTCSGDAMPSTDFLRPRLSGARFEGGGIPRDILPDLIALQEMVIEVARWQYLKNNPNRQRSSSDFNKVDLELVGIESGSAVPVFKLTTTQHTLDGKVPYQEFFEIARELIAKIISRVAQDGQLPPDEDLPREMLEHFKRVGRGLRDGESLELNTPKKTQAKLTNRIRSKLLQLSAAKRVSEVVLRGSVHKIDQKNMTFGLQQIYGSLVTGQISDTHYDTIMKAFGKYRNKARVQVQGTAQYDQDNRISQIKSIASVRLLNQLDVLAQLDGLRGMKSGWLDGKGAAPSHAGLDWLSNVFKQYYPDDAILPHTYPTPEGGVDMEWSIGKQEIGLEIDLVGHTGEWSWHNVETGSSDESVLDLDKPSNWKWIADQIHSMEEVPK